MDIVEILRCCDGMLRWDVALPGWLVRMSVSNKFSVKFGRVRRGSESKRSCASFGFQY